MKQWAPFRYFFEMRYLIFLVLLLSGTYVYSQTSVTFTVTGAASSKYKTIGIRGDQLPLSWERSMPLTKEGDQYKGTIVLDADIDQLQFKYVRYNSDKKVVWESLPNRVIRLDGQSTVEVSHRWDEPEAIDVSTLEKIPSADLLKDFELIKTMVLKVHPGTYRYASRATIDQALEELEAAFQEDLSHGAAYLAISKVLATIQCDHTFASYYNQPPVVKAVIHKQRDKLPFTFSWTEDRMVVEYDASEQALAMGTEVLAIDGVPTAEILQRLMPYVRADGATDKSRMKQLEIDGFPYRYNGFDVFYPLLFEVDGKFDLTVRDNAGQTSEVTLQAVTHSARAALLKAKYPDFAFDKAALWGYQQLNENTGFLKAGTFDDYGMDRDWRAYFSSTFKQINDAGVQHLIVDLRRNQGGFDEIGAGLMRHLIKEPGSIEDFVSKSRYKEFPELLKPYTNSWGEPWYHEMEVTAGKDLDGYYTLPTEDETLIKPAKNAFKGEVYFLVSPANVSMAYYLMRGAKNYQVGTMIGEETGGNQRGINGGQIIFLRLPHSQIEVDFPVEGSFAKGSNLPNRGIVPDIEVSPALADIRAGRDTALEATLRLIGEGSE